MWKWIVKNICTVQFLNEKMNYSFVKELILFFSVHNADFYMQEAKKLKHKADALVGHSSHCLTL